MVDFGPLNRITHSVFGNCTYSVGDAIDATDGVFDSRHVLFGEGEAQVSGLVTTLSVLDEVVGEVEIDDPCTVNSVVYKVTDSKQDAEGRRILVLEKTS